MRALYGTRFMDKPEGMLRAVKFTNLVMMDAKTGDGRLLKSEGGGVRDLPRTIYAGFTENQHDGAVVVGRMDAVEFDDEGKTVTAWGWLLDDDNGKTAARYLATRSLRHNSVRLTEIEVSIDWGEDDNWLDYTVVFEKWNIGSTTILGVPAFANSDVDLDDEITASIYSSIEPLEVDFGDCWDVDFALEFAREVVADGADRYPWDLFHTPEVDNPKGQKLIVGDRREDGWRPVYGHLGTWTSCHDGIIGRCTRIPTPPDNYASFNQPGPLTESGHEEAGPIFFKYGHPDRPLGEDDVAAAYGGVENAWADVRVIAGKHGPWLSGAVRAHITDDVVAIARASRVSGHWMPDGRLKAIVSVNCEGFNVPGSGFSVRTDEEGRVLALTASFLPSCEGSDDAAGDAEPQEPDIAANDASDDTLALEAEALVLMLQLEDAE